MGVSAPAGNDDESSAIDDWLAFTADDPKPPRRGGGARRLVVTRLPFALLAGTVIGMILLWPSGESREAAGQKLSQIGFPTEFHNATVSALTSEPCDFDEETTCTDVTFSLESGPHVGDTFSQSFVEGPLAPKLSVGESVVLSYRSPNGIVLGSVESPCTFDDSATCWTVSIAIDDVGPSVVEVTDDDPVSFLVGGDEVDVTYDDRADGRPLITSATRPTVFTQYQFADIQRRGALVWIVVVFVVAVVALGRWRGLAAIGGLAASLAVLLLFVLPAILDGGSPALVAVVGSSAIAFVALYGAHGLSARTSVALIGMIGALALTGILSWISVGLAGFTGFASEEASFLTIFDGIDIPGLVLAGIVLGAAGALDDITVTQTSAVWQLRAANPGLTILDLWRGGIQIGRDHIAATVNTLLLAYAGAALPLLILFVLSRQSLGAVANGEIVAIEIVRTLVGSIGLVAAVPLTTALAAWVAAADPAAAAANTV